VLFMHNKWYYWTSESLALGKMYTLVLSNVVAYACYHIEYFTDSSMRQIFCEFLNTAVKAITFKILYHTWGKMMPFYLP